MSAADAGYITDVEYTGSFNPHQAPAWLAYTAAINGYAAPRLDEPFMWCELGCGKGLTALLLAALHPHAEFHACDLNPAHAAHAEALCRAARIGNLRIHPASIAQMLGRELPPLDFITLHGVYSWVPEPVREEIAAFARAKLRPGGLLMASYNAMPGWAHAQPIRQMMQAYAVSVPGDSIEKARAAFAHVRFLAEQGAAYFRTLPAAAAQLEDIARRDIRYVAHEYLTPHGDPFYFSQVEARMRAAGLAFAGSLAPADNYPELMVPGQFHALLVAAPTRAALETQRDFILNTSFRADLYAAQPEVPQPREIPLERFAGGLAFGLAGLPEALPLRGSHGGLSFDLEDRSERLQAVHARLAGGPAEAAEIHRAAGSGSPEETSLLIQQLVVAGHLAPCAARRPPTGWLPVNSAVLEAGLRDRQQQVPLACPLAGTASQSEIVQAVAIEAATRSRDADSAGRNALARLRAHGHPVNRHSADGSRRPATDAEIVDFVKAEWRRLREPSDPDGRRLRLFGVLP